MKEDIEYDQHIRDSYKNKLHDLGVKQEKKKLSTTIYKPDGSKSQTISFYDIAEGAASQVSVM